MYISHHLNLALDFLYRWIMYDDCIPEVGELYNIWDRQFFVAPEVPAPPPQITMDGPQPILEEPPQAVIQRIEETEKEKQKEPEPLHDFEFVEISDAEKND